MSVQGTEFKRMEGRRQVRADVRMLVVYHGEHGEVACSKLERIEDQWEWDGEAIQPEDAMHLRREFSGDAFMVEYDRRRDARVFHCQA